jgi:tRNA(Ile2) C34 agmatinyltransferase TiaS
MVETGNVMKILLCIDDTDNIESKGTGSIASEIAELIEVNGWGECQSITRHQLLVHPDVPYTSHNSSMCFTADIKSDLLEDVISGSIALLKRESAEGSDPGICVFIPERLTQLQHQEVIEFGLRAKREVLSKNDAYQLAERLSIHLSEHGGTGQGVIGALAGVGLKLTGNDGRFKGHHKMRTSKRTVTVKEILEETSIEIVRTQDGLVLNEEETILLGDKLKSVFLNHMSALLVESVKVDGETVWQPCTGSTLKQY